MLTKLRSVVTIGLLSGTLVFSAVVGGCSSDADKTGTGGTSGGGGKGGGTAGTTGTGGGDGGTTGTGGGTAGTGGGGGGGGTSGAAGGGGTAA